MAGKHSCAHTGPYTQTARQYFLAVCLFLSFGGLSAIELTIGSPIIAQSPTEEVTLPCNYSTANGSDVLIAWLRNGSTVFEEDGLSNVTRDLAGDSYRLGEGCSLVIVNPSDTHSGVYTIRVNTDNDTVSENVVLVINSETDLPDNETSVADDTNNDTPTLFDNTTVLQENNTVISDDVDSTDNDTEIPVNFDNSTVIDDHVDSDTAKPDHVDNETLISDHVDNETAIPDHVDNHTAMPDHDSNDTAIPDTVDNDTVIQDHVDNDTVIPDHVDNGSVIPDQADDTVIPVQVDNDSAIPDHVDNDTVIPGQADNDTVIPDQVDNDTAIPDHNDTDTTIPDDVDNDKSKPRPAKNDTEDEDNTETYGLSWSTWTHAVLVPTIALIGILGNFLVFVVLSSHPLRLDSYSAYLRTLAVFDSFTLVYAELAALDEIYLLYGKPTIFVRFEYFSCESITVAGKVCLLVSVWLVVVVAVERFTAVCYSSKQSCCTQAPTFVVYHVLLFMCGAQIYTVYAAGEGGGICAVYWRYHVMFADMFPYLNLLLLLVVLPVVIILLTNVMSWRKIRRRRPKSCENVMDREREKVYDTTFMLIVLTSSYVVTVVPIAISTFVMQVTTETNPDAESVEILAMFRPYLNLLEILACVYFGTKLFILLSCGQIFRHQFMCVLKGTARTCCPTTICGTKTPYTQTAEEDQASITSVVEI